MRNVALTWLGSRRVDALNGAYLLRDGAPVRDPQLAIVRIVLHTNPQIAPIDALRLAGETVRAARANGLESEFLAALLLQESAFDPRAISSAGAIGIAQFTLPTAQSQGVNPFDPESSIAGAAMLAAEYVRAYRRDYPNPYAIALAAYNAGPDAVTQYNGVPPYPETKAYIADVYERWEGILQEEAAPRRGAALAGE